MKSGTKTKLGNRKGAPGYRTPSSFRFSSMRQVSRSRCLPGVISRPPKKKTA